LKVNWKTKTKLFFT